MSEKRSMDVIMRNSQMGASQNKISINLPFSNTFMTKATDKSFYNSIFSVICFAQGLCKEKLTASLQYQKTCSEMKTLNICHQT